MGGWHHTGDFTRFSDAGIEDGTTGFHAMFEQRLWSRGEDAGGLTGFLQFGLADGDVTEFERHLAGGLALEGTFTGRESDAAGLYVSHAVLSKESGAADDETAIEAFYKLQATGAISLKPSLQYVLSPGGDPTVDDALVGILRVEIAF